MKKIAILLPTYNSENFLEQQIDSIIKQTNFNIDLYLSDDFSSDSTIKIINKFIKKNKNIILLQNEKKNGSAGLHFYNMLRRVDLSNYDFLAFSDHDDIWQSEKLKRSENFLISKFDAYSSSVNAFNDKGKHYYIKKSHPQKKYDFIFESPGPGCTFLIKINLALDFQNFIKRNKSVNKFIYHDWLLYAFARSRGYCWYIDSWPSVAYRQHSNNYIGANKGFYAFKHRFNIIFSGWWFNQIILLCDLLNSPSTKEFKAKYLLTRLKRLKLLLIANQCRRKLSDIILFIFIILISISK